MRRWWHETVWSGLQYRDLPRARKLQLRWMWLTIAAYNILLNVAGDGRLS